MPVQFTTGNASTYPNPSTGLRVIIGDFDNDGDVDFFGQLVGSDPYVFYSNNGNGTFTAIAQGSSPFAGLTFTNLNMSDNWRVGDMDSDGDVDVVVLNTTGSGNPDDYYRNDAGDMNVGSTSGFPQGTTTNVRLTHADFNGDGAMDFLYQTGGSGSGWNYAQNDGDGTFTIVAQAASPFAGVTLQTGSFSSYAADYDGDGDIDLWQAINTSSAGYFRNDAGTFVAADDSTFPDMAINLRAVPADYDGDGDADILYQSGGAGSAWFYARSNGDGTFTHFAQASSPFAGLSLPDFGTINYRAHDFNDDGRMDLWVVSGSVAQIFYGGGAVPLLLSSTPSDNGTGVATTASIVLTFDQTVAKGSGNIEIVRVGDNTVVETISVGSAQVSGAGATWTIDPSITLAASTAYAVRIAATAFVDTTGGAFAGIADNTTLNFTTASAAAVADDDTGSVAENATIAAGSVSGNDTGFTSVTAVNGAAGSVGNQITLASGALLTLQANGTYSYDPNGAFRSLAGPGSGASNTSTTDSFTYTINGGDTATVTITVNGVDSTGDILQGTAGDDAIDGGTGNDVLNGGDGDDALSGGGGGDTLNGQGDDDVLNGGDGNDKLYGLTGLDELNGGAGNDWMFGGDSADTLTGSGGNDMLDGGAGADLMTGGADNDVYIVDDAGDQTVEAAGEGYDIVRTALDGWVLAANVEALQLQGGADIDGTGNGLANNIQGNNGANLLAGGDGADTLNGAEGDDVLVGGEGNDLLRGGLGADDFRVAHAFGPVLETDQIFDFSTAEGDTVDLSLIDAVAGGSDDAFTLVGAFTKVAGQMTLSFAAGITTLRLDLNGDGKADYQMKIAGDVTADSAGWAL